MGRVEEDKDGLIGAGGGMGLEGSRCGSEMRSTLVGRCYIGHDRNTE